MTAWFIAIFFGVALLIGIYFTWVLLRREMDGRPKQRSAETDYGLGLESDLPGRAAVSHGVTAPHAQS